MTVRIKAQALAAVALIVGSTAAACSPPAPALTKVSVQLNWTHSAQFAGIYAADQNGDYAAEGLEVTLIEGGPNVVSPESVVDGRAQFGIDSGDTLIIARAEGRPLRAIATIWRRHPFVLFALSESGISRPEDFVGKTILVRPRSRPRLFTMLAQVGVSPDQVTLTADGDFTALYSGEIDVASGFVTNEVLLAQKAGYSLNIIYPDDYGVHFYSDTLFTTDELIAAEPEIVTRFVRATLKGWTYAVENPVEAGQFVALYNPEADADFETEKLVASIPFINTGEDYIGWMKPEAWEQMAQTLREQGILTSDMNVDEVYTLQFLDEIYRSER